MFYWYHDERICYLGRWGVTGIWGANAMTATATGSRFLFAFKGEQAVLRFDTTYNQSPLPHLWIRVDKGACVEATLEPYIRIAAVGDGPHTVEVILKSMVEQFPRWRLPLANKVSFVGMDVQELLPLPRPRKRKKAIEFVGDSITEGVLVDVESRIESPEQYARPLQDDVTATYAWLLAEKLGLEPLFMGYGAVGVTKEGCGGVPRAAEAYPYCFDTVPVSYPHPDYVFINHGTNDGYADEVTFTAGYVALLDAVIAAHPKAQVIAMSPFAGSHEQALEKLVTAYNERHNRHILFVNGSHWLPKDPIHPGRAGHALAADKLAQVLREQLGL